MLQLKSIVRIRAGQELGMSAGIKVAVQVRMEVAAIPVYHTGTESRDLLPVWYEAEWESRSEGHLEWVTAITFYHNGTESRDSLPVWKRAARGIGLERPLKFCNLIFLY